MHISMSHTLRSPLLRISNILFNSDWIVFIVTRTSNKHVLHSRKENYYLHIWPVWPIVCRVCFWYTLIPFLCFKCINFFSYDGLYLQLQYDHCYSPLKTLFLLVLCLRSNSFLLHTFFSSFKMCWSFACVTLWGVYWLTASMQAEQNLP